jgi:outer membrane lipoprotein-sorting protein
MANGQVGTTGRNVAAGIAVAGVMGLGLMAVAPVAGAQPQLPPVSAEDLVSSVLAAEPGALAGTVELKNALGLPALPGAPQAANGTSTARIWSNGNGGGRVQLPTDSGERTLVSDGTTFWAWNSEDRKVVTGKRDGEPPNTPDAAASDPAKAATEALTKLRATSEVTVDGTAEVAGRPAYELVLTPRPTERTLLREIRIAVDSEKRSPLRLTVLATGSSDPALQVAFTDLTFGAQDASLFTFTPPPGSTVEQRQPRQGAAPGQAPDADRKMVGDGWDTVVVTKRPAPEAGTPKEEGAPDLSTLGSPVTGPWGSGRLITTAVGSAIITDDSRIAAGAVPEQVLTEALAK